MPGDDPLDAGLDARPQAVKTGMLATAGIVRALSEGLAGYTAPIVVDPVLASTSGAGLLDAAGVRVLRARLLPLATVVTPNLFEASVLTGRAEPHDSATVADMMNALLDLGPDWVVLVSARGRPCQPSGMTYTR